MTRKLTSVILINGEKLYSLTDAYELATGTRPHLSVPWRHSTRGLRGIILESIMAGGKRRTSVKAAQRFFQSLTEAKNQSLPALKVEQTRSSKSRQHAIDRSKESLSAAGV